MYCLKTFCLTFSFFVVNFRCDSGFYFFPFSMYKLLQQKQNNEVVHLLPSELNSEQRNNRFPVLTDVSCCLYQ